MTSGKKIKRKKRSTSRQQLNWPITMTVGRTFTAAKYVVRTLTSSTNLRKNSIGKLIPPPSFYTHCGHLQGSSSIFRAHDRIYPVPFASSQALSPPSSPLTTGSSTASSSLSAQMPSSLPTCWSDTASLCTVSGTTPSSLKNLSTSLLETKSFSLSLNVTVTILFPEQSFSTLSTS